jgi:hypothetical protein
VGVGLHEVVGVVASIAASGDAVVRIADVKAAFGPAQRPQIPRALAQGRVTRMVGDGVRLGELLAALIDAIDVNPHVDGVVVQLRPTTRRR